MLDTTGEQPIAFQGVGHSIKILVGDLNPLRACYIAIDPRERKTAFLVVKFIAGQGFDHWVGQGHGHEQGRGEGFAIKNTNHGMFRMVGDIDYTEL